MKLFDTVREKLGDVNIIAEDLGDIFDSVKSFSVIQASPV